MAIANDSDSFVVAQALDRVADALEALVAAYLTVNKVAGSYDAFQLMVDAHHSLVARGFVTEHER